jgi:hypothetical protein
MNTKWMRIVFAAAVAAGSLGAQSTGVKANVPFEFTVGKSLMPAGTYVISTVANHVMSVKAVDSKERASILTQSRREPAASHTAKLVFNRYGHTYFLSEVWDSSATKLVMPKARMEREAAIIAARNASQVTLSASANK